MALNQRITMAHEDKLRWDAKHKENVMPQEPLLLIKTYASLATGTHALDIACGNGRHSRYLASMGFEVDALDISSVAISQLQNTPHIYPKEVDFDSYQLAQNRYDLIVCSYFLERKLFPQMLHALKEGGVIIMETFLHDDANERVPSNPAFRLQKGELEKHFAPSCELIKLESFWDTDHMGFKTMKIAMVAQKRAN